MFCGSGFVGHNESGMALRRIGILVDMAGAYGRSILRGVMHFAQISQVAHDWEFVMPPM
jgi:hypothetical protein